jgi:hypothetical protein
MMRFQNRWEAIEVPFEMGVNRSVYAAAASSTFGAHSLPTYLNQFGRQSSRFNQASPSVKRPFVQPLHLGELGQLKNGMC